MQDDMTHDFQQVKARLDEIIEQVEDESMPLDEALTLYEEAVALGLKVGALLEESISEQEVAEEIESWESADEPTGQDASDEAERSAPDLA